MTSVAWGVATDTGRVRPKNEDSVVAEPPVFAVADGMGGHAGGDVASRLAVEELRALAKRGTVSRDDIAAAIAAANDRILDYSRNDGDGNAGTTVAGIASVGGVGLEHWLVFNVGDSRVYRCAAGELSQITTDHSEVQELVDRGFMDPAGARDHESRNIVTRALGSQPAPDVDWWLLPLVSGERFIVCSDGLTAELLDQEILATVMTAPVQRAAADLVRRAVAAGGRDNVTVIVLEAVGDRASEDVDEDTRPRPVVRAGE